MWRKGNFGALFLGMQIGTATMENSMEFPQKKLKIELPYDSAIPVLGVYWKKMKSLSQRDSCTLMFIATLFPIAETWKQRKCPSTDEWIKKI